MEWDVGSEHAVLLVTEDAAVFQLRLGGGGVFGSARFVVVHTSCWGKIRKRLSSDREAYSAGRPSEVFDCGDGQFFTLLALPIVAVVSSENKVSDLVLQPPDGELREENAWPKEDDRWTEEHGCVCLAPPVSAAL